MKKDKTSEAVSLYGEYVMHNYGSSDLLFVRGAGTHLWDARGRKYLDFSSGIAVCGLGHCHPDVTGAICEQAQKLVHVSNIFINENQGRLAKKLIDAGFKKGACFFCNSGAEANEALIKVSRKWGSAEGRNEIVVMENSFHGRTLATLAATGRSKYREGFGPDMPGFKFAKFNDIASVKKAVTKKTAAVLLEPVQGEGGVIPADKKFLKDLRKFCDEKNLLLLFDEVQCGCGRSGEYFAWQAVGVKPDAISMAKGIANGIPMGAMIAGSKLASVFTPGTHGSTFGGTPLACAAAISVIDTIFNDHLLDNCKKMSKVLFDGLRKLAKKHAAIKDVRGLGLMIGAALDYPASELLPILRKKGLIALSAGETVLRLLPPLIVSEEECMKALKMIDEALTEHDKNMTVKTPAAKKTSCGKKSVRTVKGGKK